MLGCWGGIVTGESGLVLKIRLGILWLLIKFAQGLEWDDP